MVGDVECDRMVLDSGAVQTILHSILVKDEHFTVNTVKLIVFYTEHKSILSRSLVALR